MDTKAQDFFRGRGDFDEVGVEESVVTAGVLWMEDIYIYMGREWGGLTNQMQHFKIH
jgi:hypothetical protein